MHARNSSIKTVEISSPFSSHRAHLEDIEYRSWSIIFDWLKLEHPRSFERWINEFPSKRSLGGGGQALSEIPGERQSLETIVKSIRNSGNWSLWLMGEMSRLEQITFVANAFGCCSCVCEETFDLGDYCSRDVFRGVKESCVYIYIYIYIRWN